MIKSPLQHIYRKLFKPAFWHLLSAEGRALPQFLVIGSMRSGTTSIHQQLMQHPDILPALKKEVHYFDLEFARGEGWYRAHFPLATRLQQGKITGEASPYYLSHPLAPERAAALLPDAKLIVILRNPVDRAYSHYWHAVRLRVESLSFEEAIEAEPERTKGELDKIRQSPDYHSRSFHLNAYLGRSVYADEISRWFACFPRSRFFILGQEQLSGDRKNQFKQLHEFLGLDPVEPPSETRLNKAKYPKMLPETRIRLLEFFRPHNQRLFDLIGETFDWTN